MTGAPVKEDLVSDGWTEAFRRMFGQLQESRPSNLRMATWALQGAFSKDIYTLGLKQYLTNRAMAYMDVERKVELADFAHMEKVRARADDTVPNKETAEALKPYYRQFCKRPCFHDEYLKNV